MDPEERNGLIGVIVLVGLAAVVFASVFGQAEALDLAFKSIAWIAGLALTCALIFMVIDTWLRVRRIERQIGRT